MMNRTMQPITISILSFRIIYSFESIVAAVLNNLSTNLSMESVTVSTFYNPVLVSGFLEKISTAHSGRP